MPTLYCSFPDPRNAQGVAALLLEGGIVPDDISLLAYHGCGGNLEMGSSSMTGHLTDATDFVGAADDPDDEPAAVAQRRRLREEYLPESPFGGGISTTDPDDSIGTLDESDDSQSLAEIQSSAHATLGVREKADWQRALQTGFSTDIPRTDDFQRGTRPSPDLYEILETLVVPGLGVVMGGGELATAALGTKTEGNLGPIREHLRDQGVKSKVVDGLMDAFSKGGAVLAVALTKGWSEAAALEYLALQGGALLAETVDQPRF